MIERLPISPIYTDVAQQGSGPAEKTRIGCFPTCIDTYERDAGAAYRCSPLQGRKHQLTRALARCRCSILSLVAL